MEQLLADIRTIGKGNSALSSADLVKQLVEIEGHPWAEMGKSRKPLTQNGLARLLKPLKVITENIRIGDQVLKGYALGRFEEAFERYLPPEGGSEPLRRYKADDTDTSEPFQTATPTSDVADGKSQKSANDGACSVVAVQKGSNGANVCAQCNGASDGAERLYRIDGVEVWLHPECARFYQQRLEGVSW
jgi:hypothetical protein